MDLRDLASELAAIQAKITTIEEVRGLVIWGEICEIHLPKIEERMDRVYKAWRKHKQRPPETRRKDLLRLNEGGGD